ncbi:13272_t:CDS:1, partial [Cetraspora pellucida]
STLAEETILYRTFELINQIPLLRNKAIERTYQNQAKQKTYHDNQCRLSPGFEIGDKVLLEDAKK